MAREAVTLAEREKRDRREIQAMQSPVGQDLVIQAFGTFPDMKDEAERASFFAVWARLKFEFADAMLAESEKGAHHD